MTARSITPEPAPRTGSDAPESLQTPRVGPERHPGGPGEAQNGAQSLGEPIDALYAAIGTRIKAARKARGWSQTRLATALNLGRSSVSNVEAGRQHLAVHQLLAASQALRVDIGDLLTGPLPDLTADPPDPIVGLRRRLLSARREIDDLVASLPDKHARPEGDPS